MTRLLCLCLAVVALVCGAKGAVASDVPATLRGLLGDSNLLRLRPVLDKALQELPAGGKPHVDPKSFDNLCANASQELDFAPPFFCVFRQPAFALQTVPQYSLGWILDHTHPSILLGVWLLGSVEGDVIPEKIGEFSNLLVLNVASVTSPLPSQLSRLTNLRQFDLPKVRGEAPIELPRYDLMPELEGIALEHVEGGTIGNDWPALKNFSKLLSVSLFGSGLQARPPDELFQLSSLTSLDLGFGSQLNGPLPSNISMPSLASLDLSGVGATGQIPSAFASLTKLVFLYLGSNQLFGTIPCQFGWLTGLHKLVLEKNRLLGSIPSWLGRLSQLTTLNLNNNNLKGTLPTELGLLTALSELNIANNAIEGTLPRVLRNLAVLESLLINTNNLTGTVFCISDRLINVNCSDNHLKGRAPKSCSEIWTSDCDWSGLSDRQCEQRRITCDPQDKEYSLFDHGCTPLESVVPIPAAVVFVFVLVVFLWTFRNGEHSTVFRALAWSIAASLIAALDFACTWTALLATYFELPGSIGPVACCVFVLVPLVHGAVGCALCPVCSHLRVPTVLVALLSRQMLVEIPWRAVLASHHDPSHTTPLSDAMPQAEGKRDMLTFTRRAAFVQVVANAMVLAWLAVVRLAWSHMSHHLASLALCLGGANLLVSLVLLMVLCFNERRHID